MRSFYLSSTEAQSILLAALFLTLMLSLFLQIVSFTGYRDKRNRYMNMPIFLLLFILLSELTDAFSRMNEGIEYKTWLPLPLWLLWCIVAAADFLLIWEIVRLRRLKRQELSRDSVKQAMDLLPSGICYFTPSGSVKLCNMQMHILFRTLSQSDLQTLTELQDALAHCDAGSGVIRLSHERQTYLFPDGKAWRYRQNVVTDEDGAVYTETIFSDMTELYHKKLELKEQIKQLNAISHELKLLSDNVLILTREKEVLSAKTKLHDYMGAGLIAMRQILRHNQTEEAANAIELLRQAVSTIKNDNTYPQGRSELDGFMHDAEAIGIKVNLSGELPEQEELRCVMILAMRECLTNSVRHAGATALHVAVEKNGDSFSMKITNDGKAPETEVVPKGGLHNLYRHIADCGGTMEIQWKPVFVLTVVLPETKEGT